MDAKLEPINVGQLNCCVLTFKGLTTFGKAIRVKNQNMNVEDG
jgi:hypothetical protein